MSGSGPLAAFSVWLISQPQEINNQQNRIKTYGAFLAAFSAEPIDASQHVNQAACYFNGQLA